MVCLNNTASKGRRGHSRREHAAFTLLEVVLAIIIAIGILVVALFFYQQAANLRTQLLEETEHISTARMLMDRITMELRTVYQTAASSTRLTGDSNAIQFVRTDLPTLSDWTGSPLGRAASPESDLKIVSYRLHATDVTNITGLVRDEKPLVETRTLIEAGGAILDTNRAPETRALPVISAIRFVYFRYWNGSDWQETWNSAALPKGVEVSLSAEPAFIGIETNTFPAEIFRRVIYLPAAGADDSALASSDPFLETDPAMEVGP